MKSGTKIKNRYSIFARAMIAIAMFSAISCNSLMLIVIVFNYLRKHDLYNYEGLFLYIIVINFLCLYLILLFRDWAKNPQILVFRNFYEESVLKSNRHIISNSFIFDFISLHLNPLLNCFKFSIGLANPRVKKTFLFEIDGYGISTNLHNKWKEAVLDLLKDAKFVVVIMDELGDNLMWEINISIETLTPQRVLILVPDKQEYISIVDSHYKSTNIIKYKTPIETLHSVAELLIKAFGPVSLLKFLTIKHFLSGRTENWLTRFYSYLCILVDRPRIFYKIPKTKVKLIPCSYCQRCSHFICKSCRATWCRTCQRKNFHVHILTLFRISSSKCPKCKCVSVDMI